MTPGLQAHTEAHRATLQAARGPHSSRYQPESPCTQEKQPHAEVPALPSLLRRWEPRLGLYLRGRSAPLYVSLSPGRGTGSISRYQNPRLSPGKAREEQTMQHHPPEARGRASGAPSETFGSGGGAESPLAIGHAPRQAGQALSPPPQDSTIFVRNWPKGRDPATSPAPSSSAPATITRNKSHTDQWQRLKHSWDPPPAHVQQTEQPISSGHLGEPSWPHSNAGYRTSGLVSQAPARR